MQVKLTNGEQARLRYTTTSNVEAWTYWVQGLSFHRHAVTKENTIASQLVWEKALALDPASASLNAMLGFVHNLTARFGGATAATPRLKNRGPTPAALSNLIQTMLTATLPLAYSLR
jgi:hypothetical protein